MPRLFTAIKMPPLLAQRLSLWGGGLQGARWIDWHNMHITLCYLGDVESRRLPALFKTLQNCAKGQIPIRLDHLDVFGSRKPRSLFAAVKANPEILRLQNEQVLDLRKSGFELERRKYIPHVTLARLVNVKSRALAQYLQMRGHFEPIEFVANRICLLSSRQSRGGGPYAVEAEFMLDASPHPLRQRQDGQEVLGMRA